MSDSHSWQEHYRSGNIPWDSGRPSAELMRVVAAENIVPCRALELGCGTGTNSVWLAQQGFDVTALDIAELAIESARQRAAAAGMSIRFLTADLLDPPDFDTKFAFFFDRGCYHAVRRDDPQAYAEAVADMLTDNARGLVLAGNAAEPHVPGPPVVTECDIRAELGPHFHIEQLTEFRFDSAPGSDEHFLAWSILVRKKP